MTNNEIDFLQSLAEDILVYCTEQRIKNREHLKKFQVLNIQEKTQTETNDVADGATSLK